MNRGIKILLLCTGAVSGASRALRLQHMQARASGRIRGSISEETKKRLGFFYLA